MSGKGREKALCVGRQNRITKSTLHISQTMRMLNLFREVQLCATLRTVANQAPLSMGFSKQGYWSRLPCPPPLDLPDPMIESASLTSTVLMVRPVLY